ncbi:formyltransferase family protein [Bacterioplanoides sp.]|uniref:formyltransferase family protein n=1 Tax=Bacterioplanoides sp. TaxID=2066072 RepID=UPI003B003533
MRISVVCSNPAHPVWPELEDWCQQQRLQSHQVELVCTLSELTPGDLLFLVSCGDIVSDNIRSQYQKTLVLHASDLPEGRGWSPYIWDILAGKNRITVSLLEAREPVDSGDVFLKKSIELTGHELLSEIHQQLFAAECELMSCFVQEYPELKAQPQDEKKASYYRLRTPDDSELDIDLTIREQFNQLRVADNQRFPAFFNHHGRKYRLLIEDVTDE